MRGRLQTSELLGSTPAFDGREEVLGAFVSSTRRLVEGGSLEEALSDLVRAAALLTGADAVIARVNEFARRHRASASTERTPPNPLVARAVYAESEALATELEGSKVDAEEIGAEEWELSELDGDGSVPAAIRRAAARTHADAAWVIPVVTSGDRTDAAVPAPAGATAATLELFRRGRPFSPDEQALGRLAAAQVAVAIELAEALRLAATDAERARLSLELIGDALAAGSDESETAEQVVRVAVDAAGATGAILWRLDPDGPPFFLAAHGFDELPDLRSAGEAAQLAVEERATNGASGADSTASVLPLGEPPAGALQLFFGETPPPGHAELLSAFAARAAVALRRTRRAQLVASALKRAQTIVAVVSQAISRLSLSHTLETAVERISELTASAHVAVYLREGERLVAAASRGLEGSHTDLAERLLELALGPFRGRGFLFIDDMRRDPRLTGLEPVLTETGVRRALVVPLVVREEVIGALAVYKTRARPYRMGEEGLLIALSSQLAVAVQNARLHERTKELGSVLERALESERKSARQLRGLFEISHSFARSLSLEATLDAVAKTMVELFTLDAAAIRMPDERGRELVTRAVYLADEKIGDAARTILGPSQPMGAPLVQEMLASGRPVVLSPQIVSDSPGDRLLEPFLVKGSTAAVLPLATPAEVLGTLTLLSLDPSRPLDAETVDAAAAIGAQAALAIDNARLYQQQRDFAETMQRSLLPRALTDVGGLEVGHVYQSSARVDVGGDVYDFLSLEDGRLTVVLGDVTGKGIKAAADMAMVKYAFRSLARLYPEPSQFLARANEVVVEEVGLGKFVTMLYAVVDPRTRRFATASAGHPPSRLVHPDGRVTAVACRGLALGIQRGEAYEEERLELESGSVVVLYTDGVIETRRDGELYGEGRLDALLAQAGRLPAQELAEAIVADCRAFSGGELDDDCAVVCLRMAP